MLMRSQSRKRKITCFQVVHCIKKEYMALFATAEVWPLKSERTSSVLLLFSLFFAWLEALFKKKKKKLPMLVDTYKGKRQQILELIEQ